MLVDGVDVRRLDPAELRREVAVVSDDAFLFSAPLADNIAYARPDASEAEIMRAAERAGLGELWRTCPRASRRSWASAGYTLSGGQRQRVAIARALLAEPRILILDDATSSVDATTESRIKSALAEVMKGRTTFVIAHRLSTIALADEVVVLEDGEIVARGTHDELLEESPLYREIAEKGLPGQVFLTARGPGARGGGTVRRIWSDPARRGAPHAKAAAPVHAAAARTATRVILTLVALDGGHRRRARPAVPGRPGRRRDHRPGLGAGSRSS